MTGRDKPVQMAVGRFQGCHVVLDLGCKSTQPRRQSTELEVAPQAAWTKKATQESASSEDAIQLLALFLQKFALCFAHLERGGVAKVPKVVKMVVESFQLRQDRPQIAGAFRNLTLTGRFDRLAIRKRMGNAVYPGNALCKQHAKVCLLYTSRCV